MKKLVNNAFEILLSKLRNLFGYEGLYCKCKAGTRAVFVSNKDELTTDFKFGLFPYIINGIKKLENSYFRDISLYELAEIEQIKGHQCQPIGIIGYYYQVEVWIPSMESFMINISIRMRMGFLDVFTWIKQDLRQCKFGFRCNENC